MQDIRWKAFWIILGLCAICSIFFVNTHNVILTLALFASGLFVYLLRFIYQFRRLQQWLTDPSPENVPEASGSWGVTFRSLFQTQREHQRAEAQLNAALEGFKRATDALPDGIVILNRRNEIEWCNPAAEILLGLDMSRDIGHAIHHFVRYGEFIHYLQDSHYGEPIQLKSTRNPDITLQIQLIAFGTEQKLLICRDISVQEKIDIMRRDFIANVSHELRTPLTVVGGFLETLMDMEGAVPEGTRSYFDMMAEQTARMKHLIEDLLTLSRLENQGNELQETEIDVPAMLKRILKEAKSLSKSQHEISLQAEQSLHLKGSMDELHSAFGNLVSNAIRYTPAGGKIHLNWAMANDSAVFSVKDSGIGIEQKHIDRLTERFYRVDRSRSRETGGTGLGLSIVKHILTRHQGHLNIESTPNLGSTFSAVFPHARIVPISVEGQSVENKSIKN